MRERLEGVLKCGDAHFVLILAPRTASHTTRQHLNELNAHNPWATETHQAPAPKQKTMKLTNTIFASAALALLVAGASAEWNAASPLYDALCQPTINGPGAEGFQSSCQVKTHKDGSPKARVCKVGTRAAFPVTQRNLADAARGGPPWVDQIPHITLVLSHY